MAFHCVGFCQRAKLQCITNIYMCVFHGEICTPCVLSLVHSLVRSLMSGRFAFLSGRHAARYREGKGRGFTGEAGKRDSVFIFRLLRYPTRDAHIARESERALTTLRRVFSRFLITVNLGGPLMLLALTRENRRRCVASLRARA